MSLRPSLSPSISTYPDPEGPPRIIQPYGAKIRVQLHTTPGKSRTKQSFKSESDINGIMARYIKTGVLDFANKHQPQYGDVTAVEFQAGMNTIAAAQSMFEELPSGLRSRFKNNPAEFLEFVQNPENRSEARKLGLLKAEATPLPTPPASDAPTPPLASHSAMRKQAVADGARAAGETQTNSTT